MTASRGQAAASPLWRGYAGLLLAQCLVAAGFLLFRQPAGIPPLARAKAVAFVGGVICMAACLGWWLSQVSYRHSSTRPATAVAGGLAASLIRLAVPLGLLGWLQTDMAAKLLSKPLLGFLAETLVTSYLFLLFVDILLLALRCRQRHPAFLSVSDSVKQLTVDDTTPVD